ncbi:MAG TPA: N-acyl homoserine lactonase family protein [Terriglobales bacterium]|nr:N-acyl homoserine lactonase family protein [Terriglobales bacterium]
MKPTDHFAALVIFWSVIAMAQSKPAYEVYAIRYATMPDFPAAELVSGADRARKLDIAMMIWLVRGDGHNILVDSGFYHDRFFKDWKIKDFIKPSDALTRLGLKPEDITDVVITHMHWDHVDGIDLFPKARIWVQKEELEYYAGEAWETKDTSDGIDAQDVLELVKINTEGRVGLVHGDAQEILPGLACYTGGKHTYQSQYLGVNTIGGTVVLASDNMYLYENMERHVPIPATLDAASNLRAQDRMKRLAMRPEWVIPGHDPALFDRFPKTATGVVRIQ